MSFIKKIGPNLKIGIISFKKGFASQGVIKTFQMFGEALIDECYNWKSGFDVSGFYDPDDCSENLPNKGFANYYQPVRYRPFFKIFKKYNITPEGRFVDIGSGKGKALILAAQIGYRELLGIELFNDLTLVAQHNVSKFKAENPKFKNHEFDLTTMDAANYQFQKRDRFIFLNDPFSDDVMKTFIENITKSYKESPRKMHVVFKNNNKRNLPSFYELKEFAKYDTLEVSGNYFEIFWFQ